MIGCSDDGIDYHNALKRLKHHLSNQIKAQNIVFVKGIGRRKTSSYSKTDNDATFMRMKEDHMMNGQLKPAYNVQVASEGGYIVGALLAHERSDVNTLISFLDRIHGNLPVKFTSLIADSGYESEQNYRYLKSNGITAYIKPSNYEIKKTKKFKNDIGKRENIKSLNGIRLRMNRSIQSEGVFAYMKEDLGYRRFRHRGKGQVENDVLLLAFAINVNRLHNKIQNENVGYLEYKTA